MMLFDVVRRWTMVWKKWVYSLSVALTLVALVHPLFFIELIYINNNIFPSRCTEIEL